MLQGQFFVWKITLDDMIHFDGCEIEQAKNDSITMSMVRYLERLEPIEISRSRKNEQDQMATATELTQYRSLACTISVQARDRYISLMYLGHIVLPKAAYFNSKLKQLIPRVKIEQLIAGNNMLKEMLILVPKIMYIALLDTE